MTDRELLELAAKAAGQDLKYDTFGQSENADRVYCYWNPLTDDGDALRLAVKLNLGVMSTDQVKQTTVWEYCKPKLNEVREQHNSDPYAATRRAIVRAAAELAKGMK